LNALSFNGNKIVTTDGGGAILTNDGRFADHAHNLLMTQTGHIGGIVHDELGFNFCMPNLMPY
jgi:perosamine synthetase